MEVHVGDARSFVTHLMLHISMEKHANAMKKDIVAIPGGKEYAIDGWNKLIGAAK